MGFGLLKRREGGSKSRFQRAIEHFTLIQRQTLLSGAQSKHAESEPLQTAPPRLPQTQPHRGQNRHTRGRTYAHQRPCSHAAHTSSGSTPEGAGRGSGGRGSVARGALGSSLRTGWSGMLSGSTRISWGTAGWPQEAAMRRFQLSAWPKVPGDREQARAHIMFTQRADYGSTSRQQRDNKRVNVKP